jgi:hypothetical protein
MTPLAVGMHILTLSLIALGLARTWQEWKLAGLIPFLVYLTFCLGLAAARTSGGRYIIPIDWIQYLYYAAGVLVVVEWIIQLFHPGTRVSENLNRPVIQSQTLKSQYISCALVWLFILLWGLSIPGTEKMFAPLTFTPPSRAAIQDMLKNGGFSNGAIYENQLVTYTGRAISPRFFFFRQDILPGGAVGVPLSYPRFSFILIGANVPTLNIVLPTREIPAGIKNGTVVSVAGCPSEYGLEAVLLKIGEHIYFRNPKLDTLSCPLPEIKCNVDDRTCH